MTTLSRRPKLELGVSYVPAHLPQHIQADMAHIREIGCSEVLFALQENHLDTLTGAGRFGPSIAIENGLRPYVVFWGFANTFGGGRMSNLLLKDRGMWRVRADGSLEPEACLNHPRLAESFVEMADLCRGYGFQGVFVDEPMTQHCFCSHCQSWFAEAFGANLQEHLGTATYQAFQQATVVRYVTSVCQRVKTLDAKLVTMACVMPFHPHDELFEPIAVIRELDVFGTDPYWLLGGGFAEMTLDAAVGYAQRAKSLCEAHGKQSQIWLNCWRIPAGNEEQIYIGGKALAESGCHSLYAWSFRGGLGTYEECDRPAEAWESVVRLYRELSR
jgi:hypothetical protein